MLRAIAAVALLAASLTSALAAPPERPEPGEVIDQMAHYTGLANDAVGLALKDNAAALGRLTDAVLAVQIAQRFLDARTAEIAADVFWSAADTAADKLLPPPLMVAVKAVRLYKTILEELRDSVAIPALDSRLYAEYRGQREQNADPIFAFDYATSLSFSGYYVVKPKMVGELIKAKGWNVDVMGDRLRRQAEAEVDRFWRERMEATWQQEKAKPQREAILAAVWASVKDILDQLKAPASDEALLIDPAKDLPSGWWWVKGGRHDDWNWGPRDLPGMAGSSLERQFMMSNATGYSFNAERNEFCRPQGKGVSCDLPEVVVGSHIVRYPDEKAAARDSATFVGGGGGYSPLGATAGILRTNQGQLIVLDFSYGRYVTHLTIAGKNAAEAHFATIQRFAQLMVSRMQAADPSLKASLPF